MTTIDFDFRRLEIFCKVVELGSFSKAAEAIYLTQPTVSDRVASLEEMVGAKLLDRMGRRIKPTRAGELLYKRAVVLLDMKRTTALEMEAFLGLKRGQLNMGGSTIPGEYILPKAIGAFSQKYPLVTTVLSIADTGEIEKRVLDAELELGIIGSRSTNKNCDQTEIWQDELVVALPNRHQWAQRKIISPEELAEEPFILRESGSGTLSIIEKYLKGSSIKSLETLKVIARFGSSTAVKEGVKSGLGISILSSKAVETEIKAGMIKILRVKGLTMRRYFFLIRDKRRAVSPLAQAMFDFLLQYKYEKPA